MNRDEKNLQTRRKIIDSALSVFGEKGYSEASMNTICAEGGLSKGIIYHYFKDKDQLYLFCVKECIDALTAYIGGRVTVDNLSIEQGLNEYFDARITFFSENPLYLGVFCSAVMNPPAHLSAAIDDITAALDAQDISILTALLKTVKLRADVTAEEVIEVFCDYQELVNTRFQMKTVGETTMQEHERRCRRSLQILLYGVIERED